MKTNKYKTASIILFILILALSFVLYKQTTTYDFGDLEMKQSQFNEIVNYFDNEFELIQICSIDTNECIRIGKLN